MSNRRLVLKNTVNSLVLNCCRRAESSNVSLMSGVAARGLALGATTRIGAAAAVERTERFVAATNQIAVDGEARRLGWGTAALGLQGVAAMRNGGSCYTRSASPNHWLRGGVVDEAEGGAWGGGGAWGYGGVWWQMRWFRALLLRAPRPGRGNENG